MKNLHIGISICNEKEIEDFYLDILNMKIIREFELPIELAEEIFNISENVKAFLVEKDGVTFELFCHNQTAKPTFQHICISVQDRIGIYNKAISKGYSVFRKERQVSDLIFITDLSENIFELKEEK